MRMLSVSMVALASLLLPLQRSAAAAGARTSRCFSSDELRAHNTRFLRRHWRNSLPSGDAPPTGQGSERTCASAAQEMRGDVSARSLAPWKYRLDQEPERFPRDIPFAECLCRGCIINQREDLSYNSVPVTVRAVVLSRTPCPRDTDKYLVNLDSVNVPVACTCVLPKSTI